MAHYKNPDIISRELGKKMLRLEAHCAKKMPCRTLPCRSLLSMLAHALWSCVSSFVASFLGLTAHYMTAAMPSFSPAPRARDPPPASDAHSGGSFRHVLAHAKAFAALLRRPLRVLIAAGKDSNRKWSEKDFGHSRYRAGMGKGLWECLCRQLRKEGISVDVGRSFFCGDAAGRLTDHGDCDKQLAQLCGLLLAHSQRRRPRPLCVRPRACGGRMLRPTPSGA